MAQGREEPGSYPWRARLGDTALGRHIDRAIELLAERDEFGGVFTDMLTTKREEFLVSVGGPAALSMDEQITRAERAGEEWIRAERFFLAAKQFSSLADSEMDEALACVLLGELRPFLQSQTLMGVVIDRALDLYPQVERETPRRSEVRFSDWKEATAKTPVGKVLERIEILAREKRLADELGGKIDEVFDLTVNPKNESINFYQQLWFAYSQGWIVGETIRSSIDNREIPREELPLLHEDLAQMWAVPVSWFVDNEMLMGAYAVGASRAYRGKRV